MDAAAGIELLGSGRTTAPDAADGWSGFVTSVASVNGTSLALVRIRREHRGAVLRTSARVDLRPRILE